MDDAMTIYKGKVQIGTMLLDAEIEMDEKPITDDQIDAVTYLFADLRQYQARYPTWDKKVVDGSLAQPVTNPAQLLESGEVSK